MTKTVVLRSWAVMSTIVWFNQNLPAAPPTIDSPDVPKFPSGVICDAISTLTLASTAGDDDATVTPNTAPIPLTVGYKRRTEAS